MPVFSKAMAAGAAAYTAGEAFGKGPHPVVAVSLKSADFERDGTERPRSTAEVRRNAMKHDFTSWSYVMPTTLHYVARLGDVDGGHVDVLLENENALKDATDSDGCTPLHWAAKEGHTEMCRRLIDGGSKVDARSNEGDTPLHLAYGHRDTVQLLIAMGADVSARNKYGYRAYNSPLRMAGSQGERETVSGSSGDRSQEEANELQAFKDYMANQDTSVLKSSTLTTK